MKERKQKFVEISQGTLGKLYQSIRFAGEDADDQGAPDGKEGNQSGGVTRHDCCCR